MLVGERRETMMALLNLCRRRLEGRENEVSGRREREGAHASASTFRRARRVDSISIQFDRCSVPFQVAKTGAQTRCMQYRRWSDFYCYERCQSPFLSFRQPSPRFATGYCQSQETVGVQQAEARLRAPS